MRKKKGSKVENWNWQVNERMHGRQVRDEEESESEQVESESESEEELSALRSF